MIGVIIGIIIFFIFLILGIYLFFRHQLNGLKDELKVMKGRNAQLHQDLFRTSSDYNDKFNELQHQWYQDRELLKEYEEGARQNADLDKDLEDKGARLAAINNDIQEASTRLENLKEVGKQYDEMSTELVKLANDKLVAEEDIKKCKNIIDDYCNNIEKLKKRYQSELKVEEEKTDGWIFELNANEERLIGLLSEIGGMYRELREDLATIEWKKIWLPKIQELNGKVGLDKKGIYKIEVKDSDGICYIGQAVNIKERWYQHIKKMIGAMPKGNEKLYRFRPEDMIWSIVVSGDDVNLNEEERFWIDFFKSKEVGLNKI